LPFPFIVLGSRDLLISAYYFHFASKTKTQTNKKPLQNAFDIAFSTY